MMTRLGISFMQLISYLPLGWIRALGWVLGWVLYVLVVPRRRVVDANLALCFPEWSAQRRRALVPKVFVRFAQAWLDRGWLWHAPADVTRRRITLVGAVHEFEGNDPTVIFLPHFVGMDAGWTGFTQQLPRKFTTIYTDQANKQVDAWIARGRLRFGEGRLFSRADGVRTIVSALRKGEPLCLLPDMNYGPEESVFVPFFGVDAATVPSLSRFARLSQAKVVAVVAQMTPQGYTLHVHPAWKDFPTSDLIADTALMNHRLEGYITAMPEQYYWVHKRFKTRPQGQPSVY